jgi:hypothetical protein
MYNVSNEFLTEIKKPSRTVSGKVTIGSTELDLNTIVDFSVESSMGSSAMPTIGGVVSNKLKLKLINDSNVPTVLIGTPIIPEVAVEVDGVFEWIKLGEFYADTNDVVKNEQIVTINAFDNMVSFDQIQYTTDLEFPVSLESFTDDIVTRYGVSFVGVNFSSYGLIINEKPTGTLRQIFSWIASLLTKNAMVDENGDITFKYINPTTFDFDGNNYIDFKLTSDSIVDFTQLQVPKGDGEETLLFGDGSGKSISFENPLITTNGELQTVYEREFPLSYFAYTMTTQGFPHLQIGDVVAFTDVANVTRDLIIVHHNLTFNGGLNSSFKVESPKDTIVKTTVTSGSTVASAITKAYDSLLLEIAESTNLITGNSGGYVAMIKDPITGKPQEIIITDTDDINTAMKVWRWNASGLGFSSTGYNGDYELAINELGKINANFITTGLLNADIIKAGTLESLDGKSSINMTNGTFSFGEGRLRWDGSDTLVFGAVNGQQNITISNSQIQFLYNGSATAYINQEKMFIKNLEVTAETILGVHKITKYNNNMTIIKYIG